MLEWYRPGWKLDALIAEVGELVSACLGRQAWETCSYRELFLDLLDIDPLTAPRESLARAARECVDTTGLALDRDGWLDLRFVSATAARPPRVSRIRILPVPERAGPPPDPEVRAHGGPGGTTLSWQSESLEEIVSYAFTVNRPQG